MAKISGLLKETPKVQEETLQRQKQRKDQDRLHPAVRAEISIAKAVPVNGKNTGPQSSRNPEIDKIVGKKPRLMLLNKADCADAAATEQWLTYYRKKGIPAMACDCRSGRGVKNLLPAVREVLADKIAAWNEKGMVGRPIRMMIVGIPNVGKSSLINRLSGTRSAKVEDRPGVTRGKQWVSLEDGIELLDMPGVLWPKFEDKVVKKSDPIF